MNDHDTDFQKCNRCKQETPGALYGDDECFNCYQIDFDLDNDLLEE